jgi:hypothetical protein
MGAMLYQFREFGKGRLMGEFNLDEVTMHPFEVEDNLLEFNENNPDIIEDFMKAEYGDDELDIDTPIKEKSQEQIAEEIEDMFISLLNQEDVESILALTGETPYATDVISEDYFRGFTGNYSQALLFNPAIKWYAKLLKLLPENKFCVDGGSLKLKISPQFFKKTIYPFMGDFKIGLRETSPIVNLIYNLAESLKDQDVEDKMKMILDSQKSHSSDGDDLNAGDLNFEENMLDIETVNADLDVDEDDSMGGTGVDFNNNHSINIRLQDLANKTIAQYFIENEVTDKVDIVAKLSDEGFSKSRMNEIIGIINYMILEDSLPRQQGERGAGNINFRY